jgi:hypothetical protein
MSHRLIATVDIALSASSLDATPRRPCGYQLVAGDARRRLNSVGDGLMSGSGGDW